MRNINIFIVNFFTKALELNSMLTAIPQKSIQILQIILIIIFNCSILLTLLILES